MHKRGYFCILSIMEEKTLRILEFDKIIERLTDFATSDAGRKYCAKLKPSANYRHISLWQKNTADACTRIRLAGSSVSFRGVKDITDILKRLQVGAVLSARELLTVSSVLTVSDRARRFDNSDSDREDSLSEMFSMIEPLVNINRTIQSCIPDEDQIADDASAGLMSVRRRMRKTESSIHDTMAARLNACRDYLTDAVITQRDGRYCLPVKAEYKAKVPGMVHDASSTGLTLFIEPMAVVSLNNELRELEIEELKEIEKVLRDLSESLIPYIDTISDNIKILTKLDMIFAKALYANAIGATEPVFSKDRSIDLKEARHPLIDPKKVVPISVRLGGEFDLLIITGPNTGGKTVSLKTTGLLTLMAQSGLHIPAADGSVMGIYEQVYADIGDEQSIEQSLSTFSAHMTNIVHILEVADSHSLCLFDELGSGTDPTEGAALGIAILDFLHRMKAHTMATTHYSEIKIYALETEGVQNACCEFNVETLQPTYKLLIGIPGKSNAFAISERLGLPQFIIDEAKQRIDAENENFEDLIRKLNEDRIQAEQSREEADRYKTEVEVLRNRLKQREEKLEVSRDKILSEAKNEAQRILKDAKETADTAIRNINRLKSVEDFAKAEREREKIRKNLKDTNSGRALDVKGPSKPVSPKKLQVGDEVRVMPMGGVTGTVTTLPDKDGNIFVQIGFMKSKVRVKDVEYAGGAQPEAKSGAKSGSGKYGSGKSGSGKSGSDWGSSGGFAPKAMSVSHEVNLIGMTTDEALPVFEKFLDDAYIAHLDQVRIVHGRGTGALKNMVHERLRKIKYVDSYRLGVFGEGDTGVTIVKFK